MLCAVQVVCKSYLKSQDRICGCDTQDTGLGLGPLITKQEVCSARLAKAGQEKIETMHEPKPIQAMGTLCEDKVMLFQLFCMSYGSF